MNAALQQAIQASIDMGTIIEVEVADVYYAIADIQAAGWETDHVTMDSGKEDVWGWNEKTKPDENDWRLRLVKARPSACPRCGGPMDCDLMTGTGHCQCEYADPCFLPVPRLDEVEARLLVEAAIFGDVNPEEHAAVMGCYIMDLDRESALEAERWRRLPVPMIHERACAFRVITAISGKAMSHAWAVLMVIMYGDADSPQPEGMWS